MKKDPSVLKVTYVKHPPKGCPKFDVIKVKLINCKGEDYGMYMTPDEALYLASQLTYATVEAMWDDPSFCKRFVYPRRKVFKNHKKS